MPTHSVATEEACGRSVQQCIPLRRRIRPRDDLTRQRGACSNRPSAQPRRAAAQHRNIFKNCLPWRPPPDDPSASFCRPTRISRCDLHVSSGVRGTGLGSGRSARRAAGAGCDNAASASRRAWPPAIRQRRQGQGHPDRTWPQDVSVPLDGATVLFRKDSGAMCPLVAPSRQRCRFAGRSLPGSCGNRSQRCARPGRSTGGREPPGLLLTGCPRQARTPVMASMPWPDPEL